MLSWKPYNANPEGKRVGDCTVRAISTLLEEPWEKTYAALCIWGFRMHDMPSSDAVWGAYLFSRGYRRGVSEDACPECSTVREFVKEYPKGRYLLKLPGHVVAVIDGEYHDTFDSGGETPIYYWRYKDGME